MKRLVRILTIGAVVAGAAAAIPSSASAGTYTKITSPKGPGQSIFQYQDSSGASPTFSVAGQTSVDVTTNVNIYCFTDSDRQAEGPLNAAPIPVNTTTSPHSFSATGLSTPGNSAVACVLRAVPDTYTGITSGQNSGYVAAYSGPTYYLGVHAVQTNSVSKKTVSIVEAVGTKAVFVFGTPDNFGTAIGVPLDNFSKTPPLVVPPSEFNYAIAPANVVNSSATSTHSEIRIDGVNAYLPSTLDGYVTDHTLVPSIAFSTSRSASTGEVTSVETIPLRTCGATYPQSSGTCTVVSNPGVSMKRTTVSSAGGQLLTVHDKFISTDHASHSLSLEYLNEFMQQTDGQVGVKLPGHAWSGVPAGQTFSNLPKGPSTIFATSDLYATDNAPDRQDEAFTYSGRPSVFFNDGNIMALRYSRSIPKNGSANVTLGLGNTFSMSTLTSLANAEQKAFLPKLALTAPAAKTSDNTPTIKGKVTNPSNGFPAKVTITIGTKSKTVAVNQATGTFAVTWTALANGKHVAKAKAIDPAGLTLTASRTFTCT